MSPLAKLRVSLPQGGSLPAADWLVRHRVIVSLLWMTNLIVAAYAVLAHGSGWVRYIPELVAQVIFGLLASWEAPSRKWRAVAASMGLLTAAATLIEVSGGLIEMHFAFFVVVVILTLYEDWVPFLLAVGFVLVHHGVMGTVDPRAVFHDRNEWDQPWLWAALHAMFVAAAGTAGVVAWGLNERVRDDMRAAAAQLERIALTDALTGLANRRRLMTDLDSFYRRGGRATLAIFDLNGFKEYNDRFGHPAGDSLLVRLGARLNANLGDLGTAYRLGGDEFCVLLVQDGRAAGLDTLPADWDSLFAEHGEGFSISAAGGSASLPGEADTPAEALRLCDRRMYLLKHDRRASTLTQTRDVLLAALAAHDSEFGEPVNGVAATAERVGVTLGVSTADLHDLRYAAELHDIGKVAIPDTIISKPGPLDQQEWEFIRRRTVIGERILAASPAMARVALIVRSKCERFDGLGYPDRLHGEEIPLCSRIVSVCSAYEAMTSPRNYRRQMSQAAALVELRSCSGSQFDPLVVEAFVGVVSAEESEPLPAGAVAAA